MVSWRGGGMPKDGYLDILPANEICFDRECWARWPPPPCACVRTVREPAAARWRGGHACRAGGCGLSWKSTMLLMRSCKRQEMRAAGLMLPLPASCAPCASCVSWPLPPCSLRAVVVGQTLEKSLFLKNNSDYAVAFKVKTTAPKRYCVRPNSSVIKAHESIQVRIVMQVRLPCLRPACTLLRLTRPLCATIAQRRAWARAS